jgi:hypothetical protein
VVHHSGFDPCILRRPPDHGPGFDPMQRPNRSAPARATGTGKLALQPGLFQIVVQVLGLTPTIYATKIFPGSHTERTSDGQDRSCAPAN